MGIFTKTYPSIAEYTQKQLRDLGKLPLASVKQLDKSYPTDGTGARVLADYEKKLAAATRPHPLIAERNRCLDEIDTLLALPQHARPAGDRYHLDTIRALYWRLEDVEKQLAVAATRRTPVLKPFRVFHALPGKYRTKGGRR